MVLTLFYLMIVLTLSQKLVIIFWCLLATSYTVFPTFVSRKPTVVCFGAWHFVCAWFSGGIWALCVCMERLEGFGFVCVFRFKFAADNTVLDVGKALFIKPLQCERRNCALD